MTRADLGALFRQPGTIVTLEADVPGFAGAALRLLDEGELLPGAVDSSDIGSIREWTRGWIAPVDDTDFTIATASLRRDDSAHTDGAWLRHLGAAMRRSLPLLAVSEVGIPTVLGLAADLTLDAGSLDAAIVLATVAAVTGMDEHAVRLAGEAVGIDRIDLSQLAIADLAFAIRPGLSPERSLAILAWLASEEASAPSSGTKKTGGHGNGGGDEDGGGGGTAAAQNKGGGRGSRSLSKPNRKLLSASGAELIEPADLSDPRRLSIDTLAGIGEAKDFALDLAADCDLWREGRLAWSEVSSRLLLSGPPGTGKTTFARALANTLEVPLIASSVSTWLESGYLGRVLGRMNTTFELARALAPAVLLIDEVDGIGQRVSMDKDFADYWNAVVNKALELMDGAVKTDGVIIVAATNRPEMIDPALRRSGRLERHVEIPMPDRRALTGILTHHLGADLAAVAASAPPQESPPQGRDQDTLDADGQEIAAHGSGDAPWTAPLHSPEEPRS
ncbi:ATP-binding protein [Aurantimonas sp. 22II-16-19i]|uniref:AAA family ATPase n=1 Tax=Aurantimonas sp. 22II-16-19i TaxID=1317114 RepID=UPI001592F460|nr:ATP-binding protein [Aurantimonas sp. 22II-16-19i]